MIYDICVIMFKIYTEYNIYNIYEIIIIRNFNAFFRYSIHPIFFRVTFRYLNSHPKLKVLMCPTLNDKMFFFCEKTNLKKL